MRFPRRINLIVFLTLFFLAVVAFAGCQEEKKQIAKSDGKVKPTQPSENSRKTEKVYENDLERLSSLTERISKVCGGSYLTVFGAGANPVGSGSNQIVIDYSLFDRLSDDAAAVLIAEAIFSKPTNPEERENYTARQTSVDVSRDILRTDRMTGRYIAMAGFDSAGFEEFLNAQGHISGVTGFSENVPEDLRIRSFQRGYSAGSENIESK